MTRSRYTLPATIGGIALCVALGATLLDKYAPKAVTPAHQPAKTGGIIDPHTGQKLGYAPNLKHIESKPLKGKVALNQAVPAYSFTDFNGKARKSSEYKGKVTIVSFVFAECPCTRAYTDRIKSLQKKYARQNVEIVWFYAHPKESMKMVSEFSKRQGYTFTLARDVPQRVTPLFDAKASTETYLIDRAGILRYHGRIDDEIFAPEAVKEPSLENALKAVLAGKKPQVQERPVYACALPRGT